MKTTRMPIIIDILVVYLNDYMWLSKYHKRSNVTWWYNKELIHYLQFVWLRDIEIEAFHRQFLINLLLASKFPTGDSSIMVIPSHQTHSGYGCFSGLVVCCLMFAKLYSGHSTSSTSVAFCEGWLGWGWHFVWVNSRVEKMKVKTPLMSLQALYAQNSRI